LRSGKKLLDKHCLYFFAKLNIITYEKFQELVE
jgi:hypothetical protein